MVVILLLLLSLAAVAGHNDCQRARGLELMLELSDWNAQTGHGACQRAGAAIDHTSSPSFNLYDRSNHKQAGRYSVWSKHASTPVLTRQQQVESCKISTDQITHVAECLCYACLHDDTSLLKYVWTFNIERLHHIDCSFIDRDWIHTCFF